MELNKENLEDLKERIEKMLLFQLTLNIKSGKLSVSEAQEIAGLYLALQPNSKEELIQGIIDIGRKHEVIEPVVVVFSNEYDSDFKNHVLSQMDEKLEHGDIDSAIKIGKQGGLSHA